MKNYFDTLIHDIARHVSFIANTKDVLGTNTFEGYDFSEILPRHLVVKKIANFLLNLPGDDFRVFTEQQLSNIESVLSAIVGNYEEILSYNLDAKSFASEYSGIVRNYNLIFDDLIDNFSPIVSIMFISKDYINNTLAEIVEEAKGHREAIEFNAISAEEWHGRVKEQNVKASSLVKSLEIALDNISIVKYSGIFNEEAKKNKTASYIWLFAVWTLIITLVLFAFYILNEGSSTESTHSLIEIVSTRIIVISSLFVGLSLCIKNYNAQRHNQTINTHRQNALNTFEAFVKSAKGDSQIEQAILLEVTRTIFGNQHTGYSTSDNEIDSNSRIVEIIKNISNVKQS